MDCHAVGCRLLADAEFIPPLSHALTECAGGFIQRLLGAVADGHADYHILPSHIEPEQFARVSIVPRFILPGSIAPSPIDPYDDLTGHQDGFRTVVFGPLPGPREGMAVQATLTSARPFQTGIATNMDADGPTAGQSTSRMAPSKVIRALRNGVFAAAVGSAVALGGAAAAGAQPGVVDAQSGSTVDVDGTQGTMVPAVTGDQRSMSGQSTDGHDVVSDICALVGKGCLPGDGGGPHTISVDTGTSDDPDSALDPDGFQTNEAR